MKFSFYNPDQITMMAEDEQEIELLTRMVDQRINCRYKITAWQLKPDPHKPMEKPVSRLDMRLSFDAAKFDRAESDGENGSGIRKEERQERILREGEQEQKVRKSRG